MRHDVLLGRSEVSTMHTGTICSGALIDSRLLDSSDRRQDSLALGNAVCNEKRVTNSLVTNSLVTNSLVTNSLVTVIGIVTARGQTLLSFSDFNSCFWIDVSHFCSSLHI